MVIGGRLMYEDLINRRKEIERKVQNFLPDESCPFCSSQEVSAIQGTFVAGNYAQILMCVVCSATWTITYDQDLNIID